MKSLLLITQIVISIFLTGFILVQAKGTGLGSTFGASHSSSFTRRGLEKVLFKLTFVLTALFLIVSVLSLAL